ncbi:MAG: GH25 family lysozyme [Catenisphaera adipataccumulans]|uniref:GH25 family lysozyme n=1 Tax=Catenisphaera adipataccumulans TaxID=700500 RepID=UPI003D9509FC
MSWKYKKEIFTAGTIAVFALGMKAAAINTQAETTTSTESTEVAQDNSATDITSTDVYVEDDVTDSENTSVTDSTDSSSTSSTTSDDSENQETDEIESISESADTQDDSEMTDSESNTESTETDSSSQSNSTESITATSTLSRVQKNQTLYSAIAETILNGWQDDTYYYVDGEMLTNTFQTINGFDYYFTSDGSKARGQKHIGSYWYCFDLNTGKMIKNCFFSLTGNYHASWDQDKIAYYDAYGHMLYKQQHLNGNWYCFDQYSGAMKTGFVFLGSDYHASWDKDKTVYYDSAGRMLYKQQKIDGYWYCFNQYSGAMMTGFVFLGSDYHSSTDTDKTAYYDANGHMLYKQQHIDGYWYCFNQYSGAMMTGFVFLGSDYHSSTDTDKTAYYDANGHMLYKQQHIDGYWYCFDQYTGAMKTGFVFLGPDYHASWDKDKTVYYDEDGRMVHTDFELDGVHYYVNSASGAITGTKDVDEFTADENGVYMYGIDISEHNGYNIDFSQYTDQFIIIRVNWGTNTDSMAEYYMDQCEKYGIRYGVYCYSYALDADGAASEAYYTLNLIKNRTISCGVWFDMEDADNYKANNNALNATTISTICQTYCNIIQNAGYYTGIYSSLSWFDYYIQNCDQYDHWVAAWGTNDGTLSTDTSDYGTMHQYTSTPLDKDVMYVNPSTYII